LAKKAEDDSNSKNKKSSNSEKRKEQNRNAQRAFRERRDKYARELEDRIALLEAAAKEREQENTNLKELVSHLQTAKSRVNPVDSSFTFQVPSSVNGLQNVQATDQDYSSLGASFMQMVDNAGMSVNNAIKASYGGASDTSTLDSSFGSFATKTSSFLPSKTVPPLTPPHVTSTDSRVLGGKNLFEDTLFSADLTKPLFTPSQESSNPLFEFDEIFKNTTAPSSASSPFGYVSALSPGFTDQVFTLYREPPVTMDAAASSSNVSSGMSSHSKNVTPTSTPALSVCDTTPSPMAERSGSTSPVMSSAENMPNYLSEQGCPYAKRTVFINSVKSLKGAEEFDLDALCADMQKKATVSLLMYKLCCT